LDKIGDAVSSKPPPEPGLFDKIGSAFGEHKKEEPGLGDKISSALGGGKKEEPSGPVDKAVDYVQEHVLHNKK